MIKFFKDLELKLIVIIFPIMCILVLITVISRVTVLFTEHLTWVEEAARYLMIWMAFLAAGFAAKHGSHFRMAAVVDSLSPKAKKAVKLFANLISILFMGILTYYGIRMILVLMRTRQSSPILNIPMWIPYLAIPVGIFDMMLRTVIRTAKGFKESEAKEDLE